MQNARHDTSLTSVVTSGRAFTFFLVAGVMIDTARIYQNATPDGDTETTLGQIFQSSPWLCGESGLRVACADIPASL